MGAGTDASEPSKLVQERSVSMFLALLVAAGAYITVTWMLNAPPITGAAAAWVVVGAVIGIVGPGKSKGSAMVSGVIASLYTGAIVYSLSIFVLPSTFALLLSWVVATVAARVAVHVSSLES